MSEVRRIEFKAETKATLEGMRLAGKALFRGGRSLGLWAQMLIIGFFAPIGVLALTFLVKFWVTGDMRFESALWAPGIILVAGTTSLLLSNWVYAVMAKAAAVSRFARAPFVEIGPDAFVYGSGESFWRTVWADVEHVHMGRKAVSVTVSAVALPIPISAFESGDDARATFEKMQAWWEAAR